MDVGKHPLQLAREDKKWSIAKLVKVSGLAPSTIRGIEQRTSQSRTRRQTAELLAEALNCKVSDLFDRSELSELGRKPLTGGTPIKTQLRITHTTIIGDTKTTTTISYTREGNVCSNCHLTMPLTGMCETCD